MQRTIHLLAVLSALSLSAAAMAAARTGSRPAPAASTGHDVSFTTQDNMVIHAGFTPAQGGDGKAPVAILLHMYRSDRSAFQPLIAPLHAAGFAVLAIDLRGHGESVNAPEIRLTERVAQRDRKLFADMQNDVEAAYMWLAEQPGIDLARVAIVGASVGASIALEYAAKDKSVDAIVCLTPGTMYLGLDSTTAVEKCGRRPLLLIAAEPEKIAAEQLARLSPAAKVKVLAYNGSDPQGLHGTRMLGRVPGLEKEIVAFIEKSLGPPTREQVLASLKGQVYYAPEASMASHLNKRNVRWFSSPAEAEDRGLHAPRSGTGSRRGSSRSARGKAATEGEPFPESPN